MYIGLRQTHLLFISGCNYNLNFQERFSKSFQISNLMKIGPVGAELFHANMETKTPTDGQTEFSVAIQNHCIFYL
jgi:hypothetical protein